VKRIRIDQQTIELAKQKHPTLPECEAVKRFFTESFDGKPTYVFSVSCKERTDSYLELTYIERSNFLR
jgi:hypothetical protein